MTSGSWAELDCPADSSYHIDMRTMLPDGSPNPTYGQEIATGLCACLGYVDGVQINGNEVTFTIRIVDNGSTDGTVEYLQKLDEAIIEKIIYNNHNEGLVKPTNIFCWWFYIVPDHKKTLRYSFRSGGSAP